LEATLSKKQKRNFNNSNVSNFNDFVRERKRSIELIPRSLNQEKYIDLLLDRSKYIVFASGPAGTGKTMLATLAGIRALKERSIDKIVLTRPAVGVDDEKHGFLPGDLNQKMEPWTKPLFDVFAEYYSPQEIAKMLEEQTIEISPLAFMRGRTFKNSWIIADEMQNATPSQMKMLLTRLGENSQMVVTGDIKQADRANNENGLLDFSMLYERYGKSTMIDFVQFENKDIERHPVVEEVLKMYGEG